MIEHWIIPCNINYFNIVKHFQNNKTVIWKRTSAIRKDDIAYIYIGSPYSEIKYKCKVLSDNVDQCIVENNSYAITKNGVNRHPRYIQMELLGEFPEGSIPLTLLKSIGLGQVQIQARTDRKLQSAMDELESKYIVNDSDNRTTFIQNE